MKVETFVNFLMSHRGNLIEGGCLKKGYERSNDFGDIFQFYLLIYLRALQWIDNNEQNSIMTMKFCMKFLEHLFVYVRI